MSAAHDHDLRVLYAYFDDRLEQRSGINLAELAWKAQKRAAADRRYNASEKGKARNARYDASELGLARHTRYNWSMQGDRRRRTAYFRQLQARIAEKRAMLDAYYAGGSFDA